MRQLFIFCLIIFVFYWPLSALAASSQAIVVSLAITPSDKNNIEVTNDNEQLNILIEQGFFNEPVQSPIIISEQIVGGVKVTTAASGSLQNEILLSHF